MTKVYCAETDCEHFDDCLCTAEEININSGHIHSVHNGFMRHWECRTFKQSKDAKEIFDRLKAYFDKRIEEG